MSEDDKSYFRRRAEFETERAEQATEPSVVHSHHQLAQAYWDKLAKLDEAEAGRHD